MSIGDFIRNSQVWKSNLPPSGSRDAAQLLWVGDAYNVFLHLIRCRYQERYRSDLHLVMGGRRFSVPARP